MASPNKQQKRAHRAKAKAKQNRTQRAVATKPDAFAGDDDRIDLESVDLTELFVGELVYVRLIPKWVWPASR